MEKGAVRKVNCKECDEFKICGTKGIVQPKDGDPYYVPGEGCAMGDGLTVEIGGITYTKCHLMLDEYVADGSVALTVFTEHYESFAGITTFLCDLGIKKDEGYVDTNNCQWAEDFIAKYKLGEPTGGYKSSGFCIYPLYKFDMDEIQKYVKGEGE